MAEQQLKSLKEVSHLISTLSKVIEDKKLPFSIKVGGKKVFEELGLELHYSTMVCDSCTGCKGACSGACAGCTGCKGCSSTSSSDKSLKDFNEIAANPELINNLARLISKAIKSDSIGL